MPFNAYENHEKSNVDIFTIMNWAEYIYKPMLVFSTAKFCDYLFSLGNGALKNMLLSQIFWMSAVI